MNHKTPEALTAPAELARERDYVVSSAVNNINRTVRIEISPAPQMYDPYENLGSYDPVNQQPSIDAAFAAQQAETIALGGDELLAQRGVPTDINGGIR